MIQMSRASSFSGSARFQWIDGDASGAVWQTDGVNPVAELKANAKAKAGGKGRPMSEKGFIVHSGLLHHRVAEP